MPYINEARREAFTEGLSALNREIGSAGELNYVITRLIMNFWYSNHHYTAIALITGVLKNVADEFYRRIASPFEDQRMRNNGDVY